jgi:alkylhydroperoxidase family enzyme
MTSIRPAYPLDEAELESLAPAERANRRMRAIRAHRVEAMNAIGAARRALAETGTLDPRLLELVRLRLADHAQCNYCMNARWAPDLVGEDLVCSLEDPQNAEELSPAEQAAIAFADLFATNHLAIGEAIFDRLREHFTEGELMELMLFCGLGIGLGRMAAILYEAHDVTEAFFRDADGHPHELPAVAR